MVELLIILVIVGAVLYLLQYVPLDETIKRIIYVVVIVAVIIYLIRNFAALGI
jgi:hypothetical protein